MGEGPKTVAVMLRLTVTNSDTVIEGRPLTKPKAKVILFSRNPDDLESFGSDPDITWVSFSENEPRFVARTELLRPLKSCVS